MPTSSGGSTHSYHTSSSRSHRALPAGPGPLDYHGRKISIDTPPDKSRRSTSMTRQYYPDRTTSYSSSNNIYGNKHPSVKERTARMLETNHNTDYGLSEGYKKMDLNNNTTHRYVGASSVPSVKDCTTSHKTSSGAYGSHYKSTYEPTHYTSNSSRLTSSSRSSSVDSGGNIATYKSSASKALAARNRNDSCSSFDPEVATAGSSGSQDLKGNVGLTNLGNTCFMNAVLQCLINTKPLIEYVTSSKKDEDINKTTSSMKGALMEVYSQLVEKIWVSSPPASSISPKDLKSKVQKFAPRFSGYNQQDAQEFLRYLLQGLHEDVNRVKTKPKYIGCDEAAEERMRDDEKAQEYWRRYINFDNSAIVDLFVGQLKSVLTCQTCQYKSVTFDPFWDLSLPIPKNRYDVDIKDCLESFMREEVLDGDERPTCAKCKTHRKCTKSFQIQRFPKILVLHLKRFSGERYRQKLSTKVNFDLDGLSLGKFSVNGNSVKYNLYGVSNHVGSVYSGHYTAYCKHPYKGRWYAFNDSRVSSASERDLVSEEAYVLFYERVD